MSSFAADACLSPDGNYLYQDYAGNGKIVVYAIAADGSLSRTGARKAGAQSDISRQGAAGI